MPGGTRRYFICAKCFTPFTLTYPEVERAREVGTITEIYAASTLLIRALCAECVERHRMAKVKLLDPGIWGMV